MNDDSPELRDGEEIEKLREEFLVEIHSREVLRQQAADERDSLRAKCDHLEAVLRALANPDGIVRFGDPSGERIPSWQFAQDALREEPATPSAAERASVYNWLLNRNPCLGAHLRAAEGLSPTPDAGIAFPDDE